MKLSIVIPALNEERALPLLLSDLNQADLPDHELIIADSGSTDGTRAIVATYALTHPATQLTHAGKGAATARNAGAAIATGDIILFLDSDQRITPEFVMRATNEFQRRNLDIACFYAKPLDNDAFDRLFWWVCNNLLFRPGQYVTPSGSTGSGLLITRALHERINGFNERIHVVHDHDYVRRASKHGRFRMINSVTSTFNMRRFHEEGRFIVSMKYILLTFCHLLHIKKTPFEYEFGTHRQ